MWYQRITEIGTIDTVPADSAPALEESQSPPPQQPLPKKRPHEEIEDQDKP